MSYYATFALSPSFVYRRSLFETQTYMCIEVNDTYMCTYA